MGRQRAAEPQSQARAEGRGVPVPVISLGLWPGQDVQEPETSFTVQLELGCWGVSRVPSSAMDGLGTEVGRRQWRPQSWSCFSGH